ncbi:threonine/serine dehydratase [Sphingobium phenoxybenzoativorans]|uniref:Threonine/serine dehydratase n=1 Tax=Sphingobium phenoxybenzoativorans TaxID=1592790 RepID=A0A975Q059_9SPHN|nr:threonine/serine dehydratase [Sphingobium phenoxybenzoativorans]QUT04286.1 threonine/serine dehydratase [Sphingobium phenoxybenzoativorans]
MTAQSQSVARIPDRQGVERAAVKIAAILPPTPLLPLDIGGVTIWCKAECLQPIGAFKIRGAWHRLSDLSDEERQAGVVAFSSGNHAQGVAWAARRLGVPATIVMPADAPAAKMASTIALGAMVVTYDRMTESREEIAGRLAAEKGAVLVPSFDDPWVIEGQGSAGIEIGAQMPGGALSRLVIPCGGGGLASGCALALPEAQVTAVEPEGWADMGESLRAGEIVPVGPNPPFTSCDALQTVRVAPLTFGILQGRGAVGVSVTEAEIGAAMRLAMTQLGLVLEPGGAVALAAVVAGKVAPVEGMAVLLSGRNVDPGRFRAMTET